MEDLGIILRGGGVGLAAGGAAHKGKQGQPCQQGGDESFHSRVVLSYPVLRVAELRRSARLVCVNDNRLVVIYPDKIFGFSEQQNIRKLKAVEKLLKDKDFLEENKVLQQELEIYKEDLIFEINVELEKSYLPENNRCKYFNTLNGVTELCFENQISFNRFLSEICLSYYEYAPKINNELINRKSVSAQIKKARNLIIDAILNEEELNRFEKGTSYRDLH